jgi:hypothetical protein
VAGNDQGESGDRPEGAADRPQDPLVEQLRPDPSQPPQPALTLSGLLGDSDREGFRRLYFTADLGYYAEFRVEDVLALVAIAPDQAPFIGHEATRVTLRRDAMIEYTHTRTARPLDEFDLDVRLGATRVPPGGAPDTFVATCWETCPVGCIEIPGGTDQTCFCGGDTVQITICRGRTCVDVCTNATCRTDCGQATCDTCHTQCGQATCATCRTCNTQCGQATCDTCQTNCGTCQTNCGQATCDTCETRCGQPTCARTCDCVTRNPHVFTCGNQRQCVRP